MSARREDHWFARECECAIPDEPDVANLRPLGSGCTNGYVCPRLDAVRRRAERVERLKRYVAKDKEVAA